MNATQLIAASLFAAIGSAAGADDIAFSNDSKCSAPNGIGEQRACEKARQGPEALRRFVERTRMIYGLYYWDFAPRAFAIVPQQDLPIVARAE